MEPNHQELVNVIYEVHESLRKSLFQQQDPNKVWHDHVAEENLRKQYSKAMFSLATKFWNGKECRIEWTYKTSMDYFYNGGLERCLEREKRLMNLAKCEKGDKLRVLNQELFIENNYSDLNRKLNLLDIGSCYNPFSKYPDLHCVAIDLTPATEDVIECDFLNAEILDANQLKKDTEFKLYKESFDIIVISLVLEYLPASEQRLIFCYKAWELLQFNGLCIIITPDSKSVHHNAPMMKSWKLGFEKIGFQRVKYEKLTHIHCMAFRKVSRSSESEVSMCRLFSNLFYIPQDSKTYYQEESNHERTEEENNSIYAQFSELPDVPF